MKPAKFDYVRPSTLDEALSFLAEQGEEAKILSGGQSLIPVLNMRLSTPQYVMDIGALQELDYIRLDQDKVCIGGITKHATVEHSELVRQSCPILIEAISQIGHKQIRNRGTVGGSVAHADPSAEIPCVLSALRGEIVIASVDEERVVTPDEFFLTYMLTSMEPTEMVKEVRFPVLNSSAGYAFLEIARRHGDFALVEAAAVVELDENGAVSRAQIAVGGVGATPVVLEEVEQFLVGKQLSEETLQEVSEMTQQFVDPESDLHGSAEYRRELAGVIVSRAIAEAANRISGGAKQ